MKNLISVILLSFLFFTSAKAQLFSDTSVAVKDLTVDMFGQVYLIHGSEIVKLDPDGKIMNTYSRKNIGDPTFVDSRDPLRILVFYRDFAVIRILDNQMAEQSTLDLRQLGFSDVRLIAGSEDQSIWIYDRANAQLTKIDYRLQKSLLTVNLRQFLDKAIFPGSLEVSQNWITMQNDKEVYVFDQYGTYVRTLSFNYTPVLFQLEGDVLWTGNGTTVESTNLNLFNSTQKTSLVLPDKGSKYVIYRDRIWYIRDEKLFIPKS